MKKKRIDLNNSFVIIVLFFPFIEPSGIEDLSKMMGGIWSYIHLFLFGLKLFSFIAIFLITVKRFRTIEKFSWLLILYQSYIIVLTLINEHLSLSRLITAISPVFVVLLLEYYIKYGNYNKTIRCLTIMLEILIIINFITIFLYPNGMYIDDRGWNRNWILGYKNRHIYYYLLYCGLYWISISLTDSKHSKKIYIMLLIMLISSSLIDSKTTMLTLTVMTFFFVLSKKAAFSRLPSIKFFYIISFIVSILIVFFSFQNKLTFIIENLADGDATFSNRTIIWKRASEDFLISPIVGHGLTSYTDVFSSWIVSQMHNMYIDIMVVGGIVLLSIFTAIVFICSKRVNLCTMKSTRNTCILVFAGYAILFLTEARRDVTMLFIFLSLCYFLPELSNEHFKEDSKGVTV